MRQWEVLKILVKRGRRGADNVETILGNRDARDHGRLLALVTRGGWLKVLFFLFGFLVRKCASLHVAFEAGARASLVIAVLFLVTPFGIVSFDAAEETKAFSVTPFFFVLRDFASLGLEISVVNRGSIFFGGGSPGAETSSVSGRVSIVHSIFLWFVYSPESVEFACLVHKAL